MTADFLLEAMQVKKEKRKKMVGRHLKKKTVNLEFCTYPARISFKNESNKKIFSST